MRAYRLTSASRALVLLAGGFCSSVLSSAGAQPVDRQIAAEVARFVAAVNGGNAAAVGALYLADSGTTSAGDGQIHRGHQSVVALLREVYAHVGSIAMTVDSVHVQPLGTMAAVAVFRYRWALGHAPGPPETGAMTLVYTRTPNGWRVAHDHTSTLAAAPAPAPGAVTGSGPSSPRRVKQSCTISRIVDGDTVHCEGLGSVRLLGMDTPERNQPPFGAQATAALAAMIPVGTVVQLEPDVEARDRYGRLLAYIWVGGTLVNWRMVRDGWAVLLTYPPNVQYVDALTDAQRRAREERRGLWASGGFECLPRDKRAGRCE